MIEGDYGQSLQGGHVFTKTKIMRGRPPYRERKDMYPRQREQHVRKLQGQVTSANLMSCKKS